MPGIYGITSSAIKHFIGRLVPLRQSGEPESPRLSEGITQPEPLKDWRKEFCPFSFSCDSTVKCAIGAFPSQLGQARAGICSGKRSVLPKFPTCASRPYRRFVPPPTPPWGLRRAPLRTTLHSAIDTANVRPRMNMHPPRLRQKEHGSYPVFSGTPAGNRRAVSLDTATLTAHNEQGTAKPSRCFPAG